MVVKLTNELNDFIFILPVVFLFHFMVFNDLSLFHDIDFQFSLFEKGILLPIIFAIFNHNDFFRLKLVRTQILVAMDLTLPLEIAIFHIVGPYNAGTAVIKMSDVLVCESLIIIRLRVVRLTQEVRLLIIHLIRVLSHLKERIVELFLKHCVGDIEHHIPCVFIFELVYAVCIPHYVK